MDPQHLLKLIPENIKGLSERQIDELKNLQHEMKIVAEENLKDLEHDKDARDKKLQEILKKAGKILGKTPTHNELLTLNVNKLT